MMEQSQYTLKGRNPDVLTCIANLSNDEVFTPPVFANQMLDTLAEAWASSHGGADLWADRNVTFLDPCTKSGVFLREITSRLIKGLSEEIPDLQERVDHILTKQVFGIGITRITSLLARRSVYCSRLAKGRHSIVKSFKHNDGNIWFQRLEHTWEGNKCKFCGAPDTMLDRGKGLENYAYSFIHFDDIKSQINNFFTEPMQFDVVIGNPPYQMSDDGFGTSAAPIYHSFVEQAKKLEPRFLCMVIPARWFAGGKGLDSFRESMLADTRLRNIDDFPDSNDVFPGTQIKGGVCYFLWDKEKTGPTSVTTHAQGGVRETVKRPLLEKGASVFIRYNEALPILKKIIYFDKKSKKLALSEEDQFKSLVSSRKPFGLDTKFKGNKNTKDDYLKIYQNGGVGFIPRSLVKKNKEIIDQWKIFIPRAGSGSDAFPHPIIGRPFIGEPNTVSSETYMFIGPFEDKDHASNALSYISTRIFRFLVLLHKPSQDATQIVYTFVPKQDFSRPWSDEDLRDKYNISDEEWLFIESMIRPMTLDYGDGK